MPYSLSVGDFIEAQIVYDLYEQTCRNVFHFRMESGATVTDAGAFLIDVCDWIDDNVLANLMPLLSDDIAARYVTAQVVAPDRYRIVKITPSNANGQVVAAAVPPSSSFNMQRWAQRSGRKYVGRIYVPGIPLQATLNGKLDPATITALLPLEVALENAMTISGVTLKEYLNYEGTDVLLQQVAGYTVDPVLRSQRRREIGVGE